MTIAIAALAIAVAVLTVLVAGLLRSHAVILRRLHELGGGVDADGVQQHPTDDDPRAVQQRPPGLLARPPEPPKEQTRGEGGLPRPPAVAAGRPAADLSGPGPRGEAHAIRVVGTPHDTIVVFLSSGCTTCHAFWDELRDADTAGDPRVVIVTKGADAESVTAVADIAPHDLTVVMSSAAWAAYDVPGSPYVVHVDGPSGMVRGEGTGPTWAQVRRMLREGAGDLDAARAGRRKAAADTMREEDVDRVLLAAGIQPGDPSLYIRADGTTAEPPA